MKVFWISFNSPVENKAVAVINSTNNQLNRAWNTHKQVKLVKQQHCNWESDCTEFWSSQDFSQDISIKDSYSISIGNEHTVRCMTGKFWFGRSDIYPEHLIIHQHKPATSSDVEREWLAPEANCVVTETAVTYSNFTKMSTAQILSGILSSDSKTTKRRRDVTSPSLFTPFTSRRYQQTSPPADGKSELALLPLFLLLFCDWRFTAIYWVGG